MDQNESKALEVQSKAYEKKLKARRAKGDKDLKKLLNFHSYYNADEKLREEIRKELEKGRKPSEIFLERYPTLFGTWIPERFRDAFLWAVDACLERPCQTRWSRRAIRSRRYEDYVDVVGWIVHNFMEDCPFDEELSAILSGAIPEDAKAYAAYERERGFCPELLAYALDKGDAKVEELIRASLNCEPDAPRADHAVFMGVLLSHNRSLQELMGKLLLAARLQEGLRQAICELACDGTLEGFRVILKVVDENNLIRFSSVKRAAAVWTGLGGAESKDLERISAKTLRLLLENIDKDEAALADAARSKDAMELYMALWALALKDQHKAVEVAQEIVRTCSRPQTLTCGLFANALQNKPLSHRLALDAVMKNPQDEELLALVLPLLCDHVPYTEMREYREKGKHVPLTRWFRDKQEARALFELLSERLEKLKVKEKTFQHCVFPWLDVTLSQSDLALTICYVAILLEDDDALDRALAVAPRISPDFRGYYYGALLARPKREAQIRGLYAALVDKESNTRGAAFEIANSLPVSSLNVAELEKDLRLKTSDIRSGCVSLLMKQEDAPLLASMERLLEDSNEQRRRGAYDLAVRIANDEKRANLKEPCAKLLIAHEPKDPKEQIPWNAATLATSPEKKAAQTETKLFDESDAYAPDIENLANDPKFLKAFLRLYPDSQLSSNPTISDSELAQRRQDAKNVNVCPSCAQARKDLKALEKLVEKHKEDRVETAYDEEGALGFVRLGAAWQYRAKQKPFPLAEIWEQWRDSLGSAERFVRVVSLLCAQSSELDDRIDFLCGEGFSEPQKLAYKSIDLTVCSYLWEKFGDHETLVEASLALAEWYARSLPPENCFIPPKSHDRYWWSYEDYESITRHPQIYWLFFGLLSFCGKGPDPTFAARAAMWQRFNQAIQTAWKDDPRRKKRAEDYVPTGDIDAKWDCGLLTFRPEAARKGELKLDFDDYLLAAFQGELSERALAEFALRKENVDHAVLTTSSISLYERVRQGRIRKNDMLGRVVQNWGKVGDRVKNFLGKTENFSQEDEKFMSFVDAFYAKITPVILENELRRGDAETPWSGAIHNLQYSVGAEYLGQFVAALASAPLKADVWYSDRDRNSNLGCLIATCVPSPDDDAKSFAKIVRQYAIPTKRLVELALFNPSWLRFVGEYLGKPGFESAAFYFIAHVREEFDEATSSMISRYTSLTEDELLAGAFDAPWFRSAYDALGEKDFALLYDAAKYIAAGVRHGRARKYADAANGKLDVAETEALIREKRNKDLLAAYTLIPLKDERDTARRFAFVQEFVKSSRKFGPQRIASERMAATVALKNLATITGDKDVARLTLRMEAYFAQETKPFFEPHNVDDLVVRLSPAPSGGVAVVCTKNDKELKSVPARIKKDPYVLSLNEAKTELNAQYSRTRAFLEEAMTEGLELSAQELRNLLDNPNLRPLAEKLIFQSGKRFGTPCDDGLLDADGKLSRWTKNQTFTVAHPFDLYKSGTWGQWRRRVFETKTAQPFKQAFRELYLKTSEELERSETARYAGYQIQPTKAVALLKKRGWTVDWYDGVAFYDRRRRISASLLGQVDWFSPAEIEAPTLEGVSFSGVKTIKEVPDVLFSEIMRDVDLAVSVAYAGGVDPEASHSTTEMRAELLRLTLPMFGLTNVEVDDRRAIIKGTLANYLVHLGSGVVHQEGGAMINILAVHSQHRGKLFLPFVDDDPQTAEVLTKILFLAEDSKIQDPHILKQIDVNNAARS
ncbi:MAG: DUF4132 domain-containing protein [Thermoguttaceae bacterium]|nr:DUF4132 domain-containing protein [Thermoguttaceae bacterium]